MVDFRSAICSTNLKSSINQSKINNARKYTTTLATFPDYVFESDYNLLPLAELRNFISDNGRLPNMPSAQEIEENGADLGELNRLLVEKVEELTLYILEMEERLAKVEKKKRKK